VRYPTVHNIDNRSDGIPRIDCRSVTECHALASNFLTGLIGSPPEALWWDTDHHLRGHVCIDGREFVVIAPRDSAHQPVVLTPLDWEQIRAASIEERSTILRSYAIADHDRLSAVLARHDPVPTVA